MLDYSTEIRSDAQGAPRAPFLAMKSVGDAKLPGLFGRIVAAAALVTVAGLFLPWTQNIRSRGDLTSLTPEQRPQTVHAVIPGRIEEWYVSEGDLVEKGDTILRISEVKQEYFDPRLLERTQEQITAKEFTVRSYEQKVNSLDAQVDALSRSMRIKIEQARNKIEQSKLKVASDSIRVIAANTEINVAKRSVATR